MDLATVLGLDNKQLKKQKLLERAKLREMLLAIRAKKKEIEKLPNNPWKPIEGKLLELEESTDKRFLSKNELKKLATLIRQVANEVNDILKDQKIQFDPKGELVKDEDVLTPRFLALLEKISQYELLIEQSKWDGQEERKKELDKRVRELRDLVTSANTLDDILECEEKLKGIFFVEVGQAVPFNRDDLVKLLTTHKEDLIKRMDRTGYSHKLNIDLQKLDDCIKVARDTKTSEPETKVQVNLGVNLANKISEQVLLSSALWIPKKDAIDLTVLHTELQQTVTQIDTLETKISTEFATPVEKEEFTQLIKPAMLNLITSAKKILDPVVKSLERAKLDLAALSPTASPSAEATANQSCMRLSVDASQSLKMMSSNALLEKWTSCTFVTPIDIKAKLTSITTLIKVG